MRRGRFATIPLLVLACIVALGTIGPWRGSLPSWSPGGGEEPNPAATTPERAPFFSPQVARAERERERFVPGRVIVRFRPGIAESEKEQIRDEVGVRLVRKLPLPGTELVSFGGRRDVEQVRHAFDERPETAYSEPDVIYDISSLPTPNDPGFFSLWGLNNSGNTDIDAPEAWSVTMGSAGVMVGVVDTGVAMDHPDLASNIWTNPGESGGGKETNGSDDDGNGFVDDFRGWDWIGRDNDPSDGHGHGTHVAGTIGAAGNNGVGITGVNWRTGLVPLRVLDSNGAGTSSGIAAAFTYAGRLGLDVVNASLGGPSYSQTVFDAIKNHPNTLYVVAAGNDALDNDQVGSYPCNYPAANLICVAAMNQSDALAAFSNYGAKTVHLGAPGESILSTLPSFTGVEYGRYSGTSMAAPHVAGAVALLKAARSESGMSEIRSALLSAAVPIPALQGRTTTGGRLNVAAGLRALGIAIPDPVTTPSLTPVASPTPTAIVTSESPPPPASAEEIAKPSPVELVPTSSPATSASPSAVPSAPAPDPVVSPTPTPAAPMAPVSRTVDLKLVRHVVAKVTVTASDGACAAGAPVVIKRKGAILARGITNSTGRFEMRLKDRPGRYKAVAPITSGCERGVGSARHSHDASVSGETSPEEIHAFASTCWEPLASERRMRRLHNQARLDGGFRRLRMDGEMSKLARAHSRDMSARGSIFHNTSAALTGGITGWSSIGENVGVGATTTSLQAAFMASAPHRKNILNSGFTHVGIGMVNGKGRKWVTVIFKTASPPSLTSRVPIC